MTVEDGTGLEAANSYISIADCDSYHTDRGNTAWTGTDPVKEAALIKATQFIDGRYRNRWKGIPLTSVQALCWPREDIYDERDEEIVGIPQRLKNAVSEAALRALTEDLNPDLERGGRIKREKIGPIDTEYADNALARTSIPMITDLLSGYLKGKGFKVVRV
jgi:Putative DnaT-like ssDNA binding protein